MSIYLISQLHPFFPSFESTGIINSVVLSATDEPGFPKTQTTMR